MENRPISPLWILSGLFILLLSLSACVRPVQTEGTPAPTLSVAEAQNTATPIPDVVVVTPEGGEPEGVEPETPIDENTTEGGGDENTGGGTPDDSTTTTPAGNTPTPPATGSTETLPTTHVVQAGETVYSISVRYGVSIDAIAAANNLSPYYTIYVGQTLTIPAEDGTVPPPVATVPPAGGCSTTHIVQPGENLFRIGLTYGYTVDELAAANPDIVNPNNIKVGQPICIP